MKILLLGSGGREHAFAWKIINSPLCQSLFVAPGNAGTATFANNVDLSPTNFPALAEFIANENIDLLVVGPEEPLVKGVADYFLNHPTLNKLPVVGPLSKGAELEGSKDFSKKFMQRYGIPTAAYRTFGKDELEAGLAYLDQHSTPIVLKADGLAAGKGVLILQSREEAKETLREMLIEAKFGKASEKVVVEEFLQGIELSVFVATDGKDYCILPEAKDYKRIGEGDSGLNTGGMGAISPVSFADAEFIKKVEKRIVKPTVDGLKKDEIPYKGFIFIGLMNNNGDPYVIEYNVRMGDPETQAVLPRIKSDFVELLLAVGHGKLDSYQMEIFPETVSTVVMVAKGYPESYPKGQEIYGLDNAGKSTGSLVFHAGTKVGPGLSPITNGGRVLAISGRGNNLRKALENAYETVSEICWDDMYFRRDIGQDLLKLEN